MRLEALSARTWLLAVLAGWAVLVWLLAVIGLGGRIALSPGKDAGSEALVIPTLTEPVPERLGDFERYSDIAAHPLFSTDRLPKTFQLVADAAPAAPEDIRLTGVMITQDLQLATLQTTNGASLRLRLNGPEMTGWRLLSLQPRAAVVTGPSGTRSLKLQTYSAALGGRTNPPMAPVPVRAVSPLAKLENSKVPAKPSPIPAAAAQRQAEDIRRRIEESRHLLKQQDQGDTPASSDTP